MRKYYLKTLMQSSASKLLEVEMIRVFILPFDPTVCIFEARLPFGVKS